MFTFMVTITKADQFCGPKMLSVLKILNHKYLTFTPKFYP